MRELNVPWGDVRDPAGVSDQASVAHRGSLTTVDDGEGGQRAVTQSPYRFSAAESGVRGPAAQRGQHNRQLLSEWLGKSEREQDALHDSGVLLYDADWRHH